MSTSDCDDVYYDEEDDDGDYYITNEEFLHIYQENDLEKQKNDIESFDYTCINIDEAKNYFNSTVISLLNNIKISPSLIKLLLIHSHWDKKEILSEYNSNFDNFLVSKCIKPAKKSINLLNSFQELNISKSLLCNVCLQSFIANKHKSLLCEHFYCIECWSSYIEMSINNGQATNIECMSTGCNILVPEDFVYLVLSDSSLKNKYDKLCIRDYIESNPYTRSCIGPDCPIVIKAKEIKAKRVICKVCNCSYCFLCGGDYHAPSDCQTIKMWIKKCEDDSETANYISANTKDCPNCGSCIEKNGGCNHMKCYSCKHEFCWMCLDTWKVHGSQYYECSKYKENPNISTDQEKAREALKKYLFYYERWDNHIKSLQLEGKTLERISLKINEKVMSSCGTWIDWQYLFNAAALLAKCRYTLQYTYPYAYYMTPGASKSLFEYQQAQLEAEIENLSWKIENAETTHRGEIENQMLIVEKRRTTLLEDYFR